MSTRPPRGRQVKTCQPLLYFSVDRPGETVDHEHDSQDRCRIIKIKLSPVSRSQWRDARQIRRPSTPVTFPNSGRASIIATRVGATFLAVTTTSAVGSTCNTSTAAAAGGVTGAAAAKRLGALGALGITGCLAIGGVGATRRMCLVDARFLYEPPIYRIILPHFLAGTFAYWRLSLDRC